MRPPRRQRCRPAWQEDGSASRDPARSSTTKGAAMSTIEHSHSTAVGTRWEVDAEKSVAEFAVKTFWGLVTVRGRFDRFDGGYEIGPDGRRIELTIDASSLTTGNAKRDGHLRSAD